VYSVWFYFDPLTSAEIRSAKTPNQPDCAAGAEVLNLGVREPVGAHGKISRGTWIAVEFSCITIF